MIKTNRQVTLISPVLTRMEDCTGCKVISTGGLLGSSAYLAYGAKFWPLKTINKRFLYSFSAGNFTS